MAEQKYRIGLGYDIHKLVEGRKLVIGGLEIPYEKGLLGHSDADVLVHAIIDALLGALAMDDIGTLFPDTDDRFKDANSLELLKMVYDKVQIQGYWINNIDSNGQIVADAEAIEFSDIIGKRAPQLEWFGSLISFSRTVYGFSILIAVVVLTIVGVIVNHYYSNGLVTGRSRK